MFEKVADKKEFYKNSQCEFEQVKMMSTFISQLKKDFYFTRPSSHVILKWRFIIVQKSLIIQFKILNNKEFDTNSQR